MLERFLDNKLRMYLNSVPLSGAQEYGGKGSYGYSLPLYFQSARDSYRTPTGKAARQVQLSRRLLGARESPLSTSEILEASCLLLDDEVESDTRESISTAVSTV